MTGICEGTDSGMVSVPSGWKLVPVEPTEAMLKACWKNVTVGLTNGLPEAPLALWSAMLTAAPAPDHPTTEAVSGGEVERLREVLRRAQGHICAMVHPNDRDGLTRRLIGDISAALPSTSTTENGNG